jgi:hypothetical protein
MVDRSASSSAGLRSAILGETVSKENHSTTQILRTCQIVPSLRRVAASFNKLLKLHGDTSLAAFAFTLLVREP